MQGRGRGTPAEMSRDTQRLQAVIAPLGAEEQERVLNSVHRQLAQHSKRYRILGPELLVSKPRPGQSSAREIRALVIDYENGVSLEVMVQPGGDIIETKAIEWQPPFATEEVEEAREIAEQNERVAQFLEQPDVSVIAFGPGRPERAPARLIGLRYLSTVEGRQGFLEATVNLSTRERGLAG